MRESERSLKSKSSGCSVVPGCGGGQSYEYEYVAALVTAARVRWIISLRQDNCVVLQQISSEKTLTKIIVVGRIREKRGKRNSDDHIAAAAVHG